MVLCCPSSGLSAPDHDLRPRLPPWRRPSTNLSLVLIHRFSTEEEALAVANASNVGLAGEDWFMSKVSSRCSALTSGGRGLGLSREQRGP